MQILISVVLVATHFICSVSGNAGAPIDFLDICGYRLYNTELPPWQIKSIASLGGIAVSPNSSAPQTVAILSMGLW